MVVSSLRYYRNVVVIRHSYRHPFFYYYYYYPKSILWPHPPLTLFFLVCFGRFPLRRRVLPNMVLKIFPNIYKYRI
jgi:hypothetical protein